MIYNADGGGVFRVRKETDSPNPRTFVEPMRWFIRENVHVPFVMHYGGGRYCGGGTYGGGDTAGVEEATPAVEAL